MKTLVVGHCDQARWSIEYFRRAFAQITQGTDMQVIFRENPAENPDILIYSVFGQDYKRYNCKKILVCGEPGDVSQHRPDLIIDCKNVVRFRASGVPFHYLPFYALSFVERFQNTTQDLIKSPQYNPDAIFATKTKFCAFLYSQEVDFRNSLYDVISRYKQVDALGKARGKPGKVTDRRVYDVGRQTYNDLAVQKYRPYKFVICCENSRHPGYVTEKMLSAMLANAIPIYLGAPDVVEHFNVNSFIHVGAFSNWEHAVARIRELDTDPEKYKATLREPWLKNNQLPAYFNPNYCNTVLAQIIHKPSPTTVPATIARKRIGPSLSSTTARTLRHIAHNRITMARTVRPPPVRITTVLRNRVGQRVVRRRPRVVGAPRP